MPVITIPGRDADLTFGARTYVMGILNVTPDSFSDGGDFFDPDRAIRRALEQIELGADILDVGGESTRPGADPVSVEEEIARVVPVIEAVVGAAPEALISVDTTKAPVARAALEAGAHIVNDISGLTFDEALAEVVASHDAPLVLMHIRGTPRTMQSQTDYEDVVDDIISWFDARLSHAVARGIREEQILVDPGIGFSKTGAQNLEILRRLHEFKTLGRPLLLGTSRKSFIGNIVGRPPAERVWGTAATVALCVAGGADVVRVHDVAQMVDVVRVSDAVVRGGATSSEG